MSETQTCREYLTQGIPELPNDLTENILDIFGLQGEGKIDDCDKEILSFIRLVALNQVAGILDLEEKIKEEREIKVLDVDFVELEWKLKTLGAKEVFRGMIQDDHYDFSSGIFSNEKKGVRIRHKFNQDGDREIGLTIKDKDNKKIKSGELSPKVSRELEGVVIVVNSLLDEFTKIDLYQVRKKEKFRITYELIYEGRIAKIEFDEYDREGVPLFIEIEAKDDETILYFIQVLGLKNHKTSNLGSKKFLEKYEKS